MERFEFQSDRPERTFELGRRIGELLDSPVEIALVGELGAGKTLMVGGVAEGLGIDREEIRSPTYLVMASHSGRLKFHHVDLYRLESEDAARRLGVVPEELADAVVAVEWADRFDLGLEQPRLRIEIRVTGERQRRLTISADEELSELLAQVASG